MARPRLIRWLRIAVSAVCLVVFVGVTVLWVRSYRVVDSLRGPITAIRSFDLDSTKGRLILCHGPYTQRTRASWPWGMDSRWGLLHESGMGQNLRFTNLPPLTTFPDFSVVKNRPSGPAIAAGFWIVIIPHWFPAVIFASLATIPWLFYWSRLQFKFSLRTLLIVTTLVAMILGLGAWLARL